MSYKCDECSKSYVTRQSRWRHQQSCQGQRTNDGDTQDVVVWAAKRKNPKMEAIVNEIINDGGAETGSSTTQLPDKVQPLHAVYQHTESREDITDTESEDSTDGGNELPQPPPEVIEEVFSSMLEAMPRTKDIMGWCSDEDEDVKNNLLGEIRGVTKCS